MYMQLHVQKTISLLCGFDSLITPRACTRGKVIGCVVIVLVVDAKITNSVDLGI